VGVPKKTHRVFFGYVPGCLNPAKKLVETDEPRHSAWWNFARTCTSKTSRILL